MEVCIITGSIREENTTEKVSQAFAAAIKEKNIPYSVLSLLPFDTLFTGTFVYLESATGAQREELEKMYRATTLVFVVPTYYKGMPGALKNFFDLVRSSEVYANKTIAFISSNHKNQEYGARQALEVMMGLSLFFKMHITVVPEILIQNQAEINKNENKNEMRRFVELLEEYTPTAIKI
ncbi:NAD(P)H-dependent oxidoreductase [Patescibacteria group bacterium]|nr:NAD(P)H-dependent oxidoreductase [Patescibacteria group bacterium]